MIFVFSLFINSQLLALPYVFYYSSHLIFCTEFMGFGEIWDVFVWPHSGFLFLKPGRVCHWFPYFPAGSPQICCFNLVICFFCIFTNLSLSSWNLLLSFGVMSSFCCCLIAYKIEFCWLWSKWLLGSRLVGGLYWWSESS